MTNFVQVSQKSEMTPWDMLFNKKGDFQDIADAGQARTAFAVDTLAALWGDPYRISV